MKAPLKIEYDQNYDMVKIDGCEFSGDFFRFFTEDINPLDIYKIVSNTTGTIIVQVLRDKELSHLFDIASKASHLF